MRVSYTETRAQADQVIDVYVASDDRPGGCSGELWASRQSAKFWSTGSSTV